MLCKAASKAAALEVVGSGASRRPDSIAPPLLYLISDRAKVYDVISKVLIILVEPYI